MLASPKTIGERLRLAREERGITRKQLAEKIPYSARSIRRWEDEGYDSLSAVNAVCCALDMHPAHVLFSTDAQKDGAVIAAWLPNACLDVIQKLANNIKNQK